MPANEVKAYVTAGLNGQKQYPRKYPVSPIKITDEKSFVKAAEAALFPVYGEKKIKAERPYTVGNADCYWLMTGHLWSDLGGVFYIMINAKTGQVIYLTHGK
ncbi:NTF2 fold immunity protein [Mucilaginibacter gilvus]|uniref:NTF2 fold domain-containing protein n=1 Tax=Mucilaginibacter gilvus TaxID=2305909 RepID=A0A3S3Z4A0_9SPHI|nr:NTF2 fold immunity protein [Mucilaginibacter gilvus]RWY57005.1 hypothetical protein EPL05_00290 [Mucilaginibacter gilvus]